MQSAILNAREIGVSGFNPPLPSDSEADLKQTGFNTRRPALNNGSNELRRILRLALRVNPLCSFAQVRCSAALPAYACKGQAAPLAPPEHSRIIFLPARHDMGTIWARYGKTMPHKPKWAGTFCGPAHQLSSYSSSAISILSSAKCSAIIGP